MIKTIGGEEIPALGFGTWTLNADECYDAVRDALGIGYRHVDTAQIYQNEGEVGKAVKESGIDREKIFLTTKVSYHNLDRESLLKSTHESLKLLKTDYIDLLLIHWPSSDIPLGESLEAMFELQRLGNIRLVGVSNFSPKLVKEALEYGYIFCNQIEYHPFLDQRRMVEIAEENDMMVTAYCPLAKGSAIQEQTLKRIADLHSKTPAQVSLRWLIQQGNVTAIPRSRSYNHRLENFDIFDFELSNEEMGEIFSLTEKNKRIINPEWAPSWMEE